jgi:hypothetical protein
LLAAVWLLGLALYVAKENSDDREAKRLAEEWLERAKQVTEDLSIEQAKDWLRKNDFTRMLVGSSQISSQSEDLTYESVSGYRQTMTKEGHHEPAWAEIIFVLTPDRKKCMGVRVRSTHLPPS